MFRIIGATIVYGLATYGFFTWWGKTYRKDEKETKKTEARTA